MPNLGFRLNKSAVAFSVAFAAYSSLLGAAQITIPASSLNASSGLYTSSYGDVVVTTGGGNGSNVGDPTGRNDDGFRGPVNLGFNLSFFGTNYSQFYINNNGNVSFGNGISAYLPDGPTGASQPVISPFFADVDTRGANSGVVHLAQSANQNIVTWDRVGSYNSNDEALNTFQLVLRGPGYNVPSGEGQIGFFYGAMQWETTDTSTVAAIGFGDGAGNSQVIAGSTEPGTAALTQNKYIWFNLSDAGVPVVTPPTTPNPPTDPSAVPEPRTGLLLLLAGVAAAAIRRYSFSRA